MAGLVGPSAAANVWPRMAGGAPLGGVNPTGLPTINNSNLPSSTFSSTGNFPPPIPQQPTTPFPSLPQSLGGPNNYNTLGYNPNAANAVK